MWPKWSICPEQKIFGKNHCYYFLLPIGPFHCAKFKKILTADPESWQCTIFGPKMIHKSQIFFWKIITIILIYLLAPFIVQNLKKKSFSRSRVMRMCKSRVMRMCNFWAQNGPFPQMRIISENLFTSLASFIHAYLHAKRATFVFNLRTSMQFFQVVMTPNIKLSFRKI